MSTEIYYFSGTGNSLYVARELQKRIPDSIIIPMVSLLNKKVIQTQGEAVGFVFPVHALTIPIAVKKFIKKTDLKSSEYLFAIATRDGSIFRGFEKIDQLLKKKNKHLNSHFILNMCNNESRHKGYKVSSESDILSLEKVVHEKLGAIQNMIINKMTNREIDANYSYGFPYHPILNYLSEKLVLLGMTVAEYVGGVNYFYTDSRCNGCEICEKICLSKKIKIRDNKPIWQKKVLCYMCFACLNYCPKESVQIKDIPGVKSYTKENGRYSHPYATIQDISMQKRE
jgi:ferredoxin